MTEELTPQDEADLVALSDGTLPAQRREEVEARVAREAALAGALERQRCALAVLSDLTTPAPLSLRVRVAELRARRRRFLLWAAPAALAVAAVFVALLVSGGPAIEDVAAVASRPPTAARTDGFPQPATWQAVGARTDVVSGRHTRTVFYEREGRRIAYTIVAGPPLERGRRWLEAGGDIHVLAWVRGGHTCVVSGRDRAAVALAATWRG